MKSEQGFTLLEVLIATVIMAVAIVALLTNLTTSLSNAARLTDYDRAALLAKHKMDELLLVPRLPQMQVIEGRFDPSQSSGLDAGWRARVTPFEGPPNPAPGVEILERVELQIVFVSGGKNKNFQIDGYRKRALLPNEPPPTPLVLPPL